ncbi:MAG: Golgi Transport, partial [Candelina submexicana]
ILFLIGLTLLLGPARTLSFFFLRRPKLKGTLSFLTGILLILFRWPLVGFLVELYGILVLFGDFFRTVAGFVRNVPVVGPWIAAGLEKVGKVSAGGGGRGEGGELPV